MQGDRVSDEHHLVAGPIAVGGEKDGAPDVIDVEDRVRRFTAGRADENAIRGQTEERKKPTVARPVNRTQAQDRPGHLRFAHDELCRELAPSVCVHRSGFVDFPGGRSDGARTCGSLTRQKNQARASWLHCPDHCACPLDVVDFELSSGARSRHRRSVDHDGSTFEGLRQA